MAIFTFDQALKKEGVTSKDVSSLGVHDVQPQAPQPAAQEGASNPILDAAKGKTSFPADTETSNPLPNIARTVGNIPSSAAKVARAVVAPVNPLDTENPTNIGANISKGAGALYDIYKGKGAMQGTKDILGGFADTYLKIGEKIYGGLDQAYNALLDDPKKAMSDTLTHLAKIGIEDPLLVPTLLYGPKGAKSEIGAVDLTKGLKDTAVAATESVTPALQKTGQFLKAAGEKTAATTLPMAEGTKIALQNYEAAQPSLMGRVKGFFTNAEPVGTKPITEANTAVRNGLAGSEWQVGVQSKKISGDLWTSKIQPALESSSAKVTKSEFFDTLRSKIIKENADLSRRNTLLNALDSMSEDYKHVSSFNLPKLQEYKEGWAKFVPEKAYKGQPIAGALNEVRNLAAQEARQRIYKELGDDVRTAYLDYGNLQTISEAGIKSLDPLRSKGLTKQVWEAVLDKAVTPVTTFAGKILYRTGDGLELFGTKNARTVRDIVTK